MRGGRAALLLIGACWSSSVPPRPPPPPPRPAIPTCQVRDRGFLADSVVVVATHGVQFARLDGWIEQLDVTFREETAAVHVETSGLVLDGDLVLDQMSVRDRRSKLYDGWLGIDNAIAKRVTARGLSLEIALPEHFEPASLTIDLPCDRATFGPRGRPIDMHWKLLELESGRIELRRVPGGAVVATVVSAETIEAVLVERRGDWTRVKIFGSNEIWAWVPSTQATEMGGGIGGGGNGRGIFGDGDVQCTREAPLFLRLPGGGEITVGRVREHATLRSRGAVANGRIEIELGAANLAPYVKDLDSCTMTKRP